ncbi:MAG: AraC family transcriptional regulator [Alistipes sp.]|nr:AraC family transcriptional regulator [Alistipes sp.]
MGKIENINQGAMMYEKIIHDRGSTFSHKVYPYFTMPWHYHPEYELIVITSGGGKRFAGDYVDDYYPGDLVLYGSNLPHYHMCYGLLEEDPERVSGSEVIQFSGDIFPGDMATLEEFSVVYDLLGRSRRGIKFTNPPSLERMRSMMDFLDRQRGIKRLYALLRILEILGRMEDHKLLTSEDWSGNLIGEDENHPVNKVYRFLTNNFKRNLSLDEISAMAGFNPAALCRYFKRHTQKSIFECLSDIRVGFACKLLVNTHLNVSQVAYESGYQNIANFNRQFKRITGYSPSRYRELVASAIRHTRAAGRSRMFG